MGRVGGSSCPSPLYVKKIADRVLARFISAASWPQAEAYLKTLKTTLEKGGKVSKWQVENAGNASTILHFELDGGKSGKVEFRGETNRPGSMQTKWVRYEGAYYNSAKKLAAVILGD